MNDSCTLFSDESVALHVTVVVPTANKEPEDLSQNGVIVCYLSTCDRPTKHVRQRTDRVSSSLGPWSGSTDLSREIPHGARKHSADTPLVSADYQ